MVQQCGATHTLWIGLKLFCVFHNYGGFFVYPLRTNDFVSFLNPLDVHSASALDDHVGDGASNLRLFL